MRWWLLASLSVTACLGPLPDASPSDAGGDAQQGDAQQGDAACEMGFADCNAALPGCETSLSDDSNCGACGRSCLGATCTGIGQCEPQVVTDTASGVWTILVDQTHVFWTEYDGVTNTGSVSRVDKPGGAPDAGGASGFPVSIPGSWFASFHKGSIFVSGRDSHVIYQVDPATGAATTAINKSACRMYGLASNGVELAYGALNTTTPDETAIFYKNVKQTTSGAVKSPFALSATPDFIYWLDRGTNTVARRETKSFGTPNQLADNQLTLQGIVATTAGNIDTVYWSAHDETANIGRVFSWSSGDLDATQVWQGEAAYDLAMNDDYIYLTTSVQADKLGGRLLRLKRSNPTEVLVLAERASGQFFRSVVLDDQYAYYAANPSGPIWRVPL